MHVRDIDEEHTRKEIAAGWVERLTRGKPSEHDQAELRAWIASDPRNRQAYEHARAIWMALPDTKLARPSWTSRTAWAGAVTVGLCAALLLLLPRHDYETGPGELQQVTLEDGSSLWIDGGSAVDVAITDKRREIRLAAGRVAFRVAKDARPFAVHVDEAIVTDIGTEFSVERARALKIAVREGEVEIAGTGRAPMRLQAGEAVAIASGISRQMNVASGFSWRERRIIFDRTPLIDALDEIDRYRPGQIVLTDSSIGQRLVSGTVFSNDPDGGLDTIARSEDLRLIRLPFVTLVSPRTK